MSNKNSNEELQSRREFFKKAAKAALPVVGAVVLGSLPINLQATETEATGCDGCWSGCWGGCQGGCKGSCSYSCKGSCSGSAKGRSW